VAQQVFERFNETRSAGHLYELTSQLSISNDDEVLSTTFDSFMDRFRKREAPLEHWMALCKARVISGSKRTRRIYQQKIIETLTGFEVPTMMAQKVRENRMRTQDETSPENLKRGQGGTIDVEWIAQYLTLRHAAQKPSLVRPGTIEAIITLGNEGILTPEDAATLMRGYRILRKVVGNLRLMNSQNRYSLPDDEREMANLAYLMGEPNPESVRQMCQAARTNNRVIFDRLITD
jgi:glutamate-ammonia-ligase adenylyltransferase